MVPARNLAKLHPSTVARSEELAREGRRARRRKPTRGPRAVAAEECLRIDPRVMAEARRLADGDCSRLVLCRDGGVIVANDAEHRSTFRRQW